MAILHKTTLVIYSEKPFTMDDDTFDAFVDTATDDTTVMSFEDNGTVDTDDPTMTPELRVALLFALDMGDEADDDLDEGDSDDQAD